MCGSCGQCKRCKRAAYMRQWWANLTPEEKREKTARRDAARVKAGYRSRQARLRASGTAEQQQKIAARAAVLKARKQGRLAPAPCAHAGESCAGRIEAHHPDHARPLDVQWLCRHHHAELEGRYVAS